MTLDETVAVFAASIAHLAPVSDREGSYNHAPVRVRTYVADVAWPEAIVSSVRAVVFRGSRVVVVRHRDGHRHVIPGGRREPGETTQEAVRREVAEESGWRLESLKPLGFEHLEYLGAPPADAAFPAGFINPLYVAEGDAFDRSARDMTQAEAGSSLAPATRMLRELPQWQAALLRAAMAARSA